MQNPWAWGSFWNVSRYGIETATWHTHHFSGAGIPSRAVEKLMSWKNAFGQSTMKQWLLRWKKLLKKMNSPHNQVQPLAATSFFLHFLWQCFGRSAGLGTRVSESQTWLWAHKTGSLGRVPLCPGPSDSSSVKWAWGFMRVQAIPDICCFCLFNILLSFSRNCLHLFF